MNAAGRRRRHLRLAALLSSLSLISHPAVADHSPIDWDYDGDHGPKHWAELAPDFGDCGRGRAQSPIDIDHATPRADLPELDIRYRTAALRIVNNGHTVQVNVPDGDWLDIGGHRYRLMQFHFHSPSEEHVDGQPYDMELHLVHRDEAGHLAVLGVLIQRGRANAVLDQVFANMPVGRGPEHLVAEDIDPAALLPQDHSYFYYEGSLTTPPCAEHVAWYVLEAPIEASSAQIAQFQRLYAHNARPLQPLNARPVYEHRAHAERP